MRCGGCNSLSSQLSSPVYSGKAFFFVNVCVKMCSPVLSGKAFFSFFLKSAYELMMSFPVDDTQEQKPVKFVELKRYPINHCGSDFM